MKLVTEIDTYGSAYGNILIHTSVKLVTIDEALKELSRYILIHTSVKLVTPPDTNTARR